MSTICSTCYECGSPIDKYDAFLYMKNILLNETSKNDNKFIDPELNQNLTPIFRALYIEKYCCRKIYTTAKSMQNF